MTCKQNIALVLEKALADKFTAEELENWIEVPKEKALGDFAFPCFRLAKVLQKKPIEISQELAAELADDALFEKIEVVGPYINFFVRPQWYAEQLVKEFVEAKNNNVPRGTCNAGEGKTVVLDYSSINVAKPFHIGHLRTTVIGNSLARILRYRGYKTVSINHLGDWGTQFGKMIVAYKKWGSPEIEEQGIRGLLSLYVRFHKEAESAPEMNDEARAAFVALEQGDEESLTLWKRFVEISLKEVNRVYQLLDVQFDSYLGESFYRDKTDEVVEILNNAGLLIESEGARVVNLDDANMPPCLILKSDGSTLYATRDIAAALYRKRTYDFDKCIYITGQEQQLHFAQWFKVLDKAGYDWAKDLVHVPYGLVHLMEDGKVSKLSTREGNVVFLEDLLNESIQKTKEIMREKNPDLENADEVAKHVGVGAVVFHDLFNNRIKEVNFDLDEVLNFDGETGPYVQYTFARASSILRKAGWQGDYSVLNPDDVADDCSQELLHLIEELPARVEEAQNKWEPYVVTRHCIALATAFNRFYHENNIMNAEVSVKNSRLALTAMTAETIKQGLYLIGVSAPESM